LIEADGEVYPEAERFVAGVRTDLERRHADRERLRQRANAGAIYPKSLKSIDVFRADGRCCGDGTRVDLAYAIYSLSRGAGRAEVAVSIRSRDLSHKGNDRRQHEYVERTIKKALATIERGP
jgi:hypothetical protein